SMYKWSVDPSAASVKGEITSDKADPCGMVTTPGTWQNWGVLTSVNFYSGTAGPTAITNCYAGVTYKVRITASNAGGTTTSEIDVAVAALPAPAIAFNWSNNGGVNWSANAGATPLAVSAQVGTTSMYK